MARWQLWHWESHLMKTTPKRKPWGRKENGSALSDAPAVPAGTINPNETADEGVGHRNTLKES